MKISRKLICGALCASLLAAAFTGCNGSSGTSSGASQSGGTSSSGDASTADNSSAAEEASSAEENSGNGEITEAPSNGDTMKWLGYYDLNTDDKEIVDLFGEAGYTVEFISTTSLEYFEKLAQLVSSGDSPDLVRYEWQSFPHGMSKSLYTPMDDYIDFDSETWSGIKDVIETFNYGGKHYYVPYKMSAGVVLIYNSTAAEDAGLDDPFELYMSGNWDWNVWKSMMQEWCNQGEDYFGILPTGFVAMPFIVSTGTPTIDVDGASKQIYNNMKEPNVQRCQDFLSDLAKEGMVYTEYMGPNEVFNDGKILFAEFGLDWGYSSAQGASDDYDVGYVPIPRDPQADKYYMNSDTFGYLVPAGAKNVKAAIKYMEICRLCEIDPERIEYAKKEATAEELFYPKCPNCGERTEDKTIKICPNCGEERRKNKNHSPMSEEYYDVAHELKDPTSQQFTFIFDDCFGFSSDLTNMFQNGDSEGNGCILGGPFRNGESYTTLRDSYYPAVEGYLQPYRDALAES